MGHFGSGKGTQAKILADLYNFQILDMGAEQRKEISLETKLGKELNETYSKGNMALPKPYETLLRNWLENSRDTSKKGIVFDGIVRSLEQKEVFDRVMKEYRIELRYIFINISDEEAIKRQLQRTDGRIEGKEDIARHRVYEVFPYIILPAIEMYRKEQGLNFLDVDGSLPIKQVTEKIIKFLGESQDVL